MGYKEEYKKRDRIVSALSADGKYRIVVIKNSKAVQTAQKRHELSKSPAFFLAKLLSSASLMASLLKGEERICLTVQGNDAIKTVYAEALQVGEVRGFVQLRESFTESDKTVLDIGVLKVRKILYDKYKPIEGVVELCKGDITTDIEYYYNQSEQVASKVQLYVSFQDDIIRESCGLLVQAMPGTTKEEVVNLYNDITERINFLELCSKTTMPEEVMDEVLPFSYSIMNKSPIDFYCRCSLEGYKKVLLTLGIEELKSMKEEKNHESTCQYCNENYTLTNEDFDSMIQTLEDRKRDQEKVNA